MTSLSRPLADTAEAELVERAQGGDAAAFEELMYRNRSTSMRLALSIVKDRQEAEDQVQNSFLNAWRRIGSFHSESKFSTWFRTIVVNQSLMSLRSARRAKIESIEEEVEGRPRFEPADTGAGPEDSLGRLELSAHLRTEMKRLPPLLRDVLVLRDVEDLAPGAVAERLGITEPAAKSRLSRARKMLRRRMERHVGGSCAISV